MLADANSLVGIPRLRDAVRALRRPYGSRETAKRFSLSLGERGRGEGEPSLHQMRKDQTKNPARTLPESCQNPAKTLPKSCQNPAKIRPPIMRKPLYCNDNPAKTLPKKGVGSGSRLSHSTLDSSRLCLWMLNR